jgi:hypothetical protein
VADLPLPQAGGSCAGLTATVLASIRQGAAALVRAPGNLKSKVEDVAPLLGPALIGAGVGAVAGAIVVAIWNAAFVADRGYLYPTIFTAGGNALVNAARALAKGRNPTCASIAVTIPFVVIFCVLGIAIAIAIDSFGDHSTFPPGWNHVWP